MHETRPAGRPGKPEIMWQSQGNRAMPRSRVVYPHTYSIWNWCGIGAPIGADRRFIVT